MKTVSTADWTLTGEGGRGQTFCHPDLPDVLLKLNFERFPESLAEQEFATARRIASLGIPSPEVYELVTDGNGRFGMLLEKLHGKKSFASIVAQEPERADEMAQRFARSAKTLFSTPCPTSEFESVTEHMQKVILACDYYPQKIKDGICSILAGIEPSTTCLHGDFHFGNIVECTKGDVWIDCGEFGYGNPLVDISQSMMIAGYFSDERARNEYHMDAALNKKFYSLFEKHFFGNLSDAAMEDIRRRIRPLFLVRFALYGAMDKNILNSVRTTLEKALGM